MSLYKRLLTQLDGKMGPALRVAYREVGEGRENGCGSFACMDAGKGREHADMDVGSRAMHGAIAEGCGSFACMDAGKARENGCGSFDWCIFLGQQQQLCSGNRP